MHCCHIVLLSCAALLVLPLLLLVRVSICLLPSSVCLLSYLLLLTVGAHPVVPDRSRLCWGSLLRYHVKLTVAMLRHFSLLITCQAQGLCWAQRVEALILNISLSLSLCVCLLFVVAMILVKVSHVCKICLCW